MVKPSLKLLALLLAFSVAPVAAGHCGKGHCVTAGATPHNHLACPHRHAHGETTGSAARVSTSASAGTTITLTDRVPSDSLLNLGRGAGLLTP
ncbi:MAG TPA: hypothetical protein VM711_07105 [Sphingomicrobium sp.]|nr:hypothetical protein [Sphingomicrobium sp.]